MLQCKRLSSCLLTCLTDRCCLLVTFEHVQHHLKSCKWPCTVIIIELVAIQVVESCKLLISSLVDSLLKAADLCVPYLDGRYNVDADEVLPDDNGLLTAEAGVPGAAEAGDEKHQVAAESISESQGAAGELGPNATILVTGVCTCSWLLPLNVCAKDRVH